MTGELREDNLADIVPEMRLERQATVLSKEEVFGKALPVLAETAVERILVEGDEPVAKGIEEVVLVPLVEGALTWRHAKPGSWGVVLQAHWVPAALGSFLAYKLLVIW